MTNNLTSNGNEQKFSEKSASVKATLLASSKTDLAQKPQQHQQEKQDNAAGPSQFLLSLTFIKMIIVLCDIITFPVFYLIQKPWKKLEANQRQWAMLEKPDDPYSAYVRTHNRVNRHFAYKATTVPEAQQLTLKFLPKDTLSLGYREIVDVVPEKLANNKTMLKYDLTDYKWLTVQQVDEKIGLLARAFLSNGIEYQNRVLIFAETRIEWFLCAQALLRIGAQLTTLYATLGLDGITYGINDTKIENIVTTSDLLPSLLKVIKKTENVKRIFVIEVHPKLLKSAPVLERDFNDAVADQNRKVSIITYQRMLEIGEETKNQDLAHQHPRPEDIAVILYTSGSTANPKGVILTHQNIISSIHSLYALLPQDIIDDYESHTYFGYLPLAHALEFTAQLTFTGLGIKLGYGSPFTMIDQSTAILKGQRGDLRLLKPTFMAGVPLILDRIRKTISGRFERKSLFWKQLIKYLVSYKNYWLERGFDTPLVNHMICRRLKRQLGERIQFILIGGAPLSPETQRFMRAFLGVKIMNGYGSTETCGGCCILDFDDLSIGQIGAPLRGFKIKLVDWADGGYSVLDKPRPRGELVVGGKMVSTSYFNLPEQTAETFERKDGENWYRTGDIGEVYENGCFKIIDRKKDLLKLQFGEYVSLGKVEAELKNFSYVENICVYGDSMHSYVVALILPVMSSLKQLAKELGKPSDLSKKQLCSDGDIIEQITKELQEFCGECGLNKMETPQKVKLCPEEWTIDNGFLTASMKINRQNVKKFYQTDLVKLYS